jgi:hypothetical protein
MFKTLIRWTGFAALAGAMGMGVIDAARSVAIGSVDLTTLTAVGEWLLPRQFPLLGPFVTANLHPLMWDPLLLRILALPAVPSLFVLGALLLFVARPPDPTAIGT